MKEHPFLSNTSSYTGRAVVFFFLLSALLCFFYLLGNYQDFLDSTQVFLLSLLRICLSLQLVTGVWLAGFLVYRNIHERRALIVRWILLVLSLAACTLLLVTLRYVQQWLQT
ncbi:MAG: hypothetical protein ABSF77_19140 [Spirochaetia bacterium]|jgi:hypothetical protein